MYTVIVTKHCGIVAKKKQIPLDKHDVRTFYKLSMKKKKNKISFRKHSRS